MVAAGIGVRFPDESSRFANSHSTLQRPPTRSTRDRATSRRWQRGVAAGSRAERTAAFRAVTTPRSAVPEPDSRHCTEPDISGGYLFKFDWSAVTPLGSYAVYFDVPSLVGTFILNEFSKNGDAYVRSVYFHKQREGKIVAGPLWDFNLIMAVGGALFCNQNPTGWAYEFRIGSNDWFQRLIEDPAFKAQVVSRWKELRQGELSQTAVEQRLANPPRAAVERHHAGIRALAVVQSDRRDLRDPRRRHLGGAASRDARLHVGARRLDG